MNFSSVSPSQDIHWRIKDICCDISAILSQTPLCSINWIPSGANGKAHALAKWLLLNNVFKFFDLGFGPPVLNL